MRHIGLLDCFREERLHGKTLTSASLAPMLMYVDGREPLHL